MKKNRSAGVFPRFRRMPKRVNAVLVALLSAGMCAPLHAQGPAGGVVVAGDARIAGQGTPTTRIEQVSDRAVIDWRSFGIGVAGEVIFLQPSARSATLNRVTGEQASFILGRLEANGQVLLINPNGIVFGGGAQVNVGSLIATTSNVSDANFMSGRLVFDGPGRPGAGVLNAGAITAKDGGLVALVAPHVRNDGVIVARLGKVALGSADTFTVDLYGDALINLALSDAHVQQLRQANGEPVSSLVANTGRIEARGGEAVLMAARTAKNVLDSLINTSGTIRADSAVQQGGRILLLGEGGKVEVAGSLSAQGTTGGTIQVLGGQVHLASDASLDASGNAGGGTLHVGGAWQGKGNTYRAEQTTVDAGAVLKANAIDGGNGGELVVWSDGHTWFGGSVEARGGRAGGDGGRMEVSGKRTLDFLGHADGSAPAGRAGSLLLDPAYLNIGADEASVITRVLRTGTTANLQADIDITVNSAILGGDRQTGGGLTMTAGNDINLNDVVVTNDGAINLFASKGTINFAPAAALFAGSAPITLNARGDLRTGWLFTGGSLSISSIAGSVAIDSFLDGHAGPIDIRAAGNVDINQPIVNLAAGPGSLTVAAGSDVNVNAAIDGRGGAEGGGVALSASGDVNVNEAIVTNNGTASLTATNGGVTVASDAPLLTGTAPLTLLARGDITTGPMSAGTLTVASTAGAVAVNGLIDAATGDTRLSAGTDVTINQAIVNGQSGGDLTVTAGRDVTVSAAVDGRGGVAGGTVTLTAAGTLAVNESVATNNGAIDLTARTGALRVADGQGLFAGTAPITLRSGGDLTTGATRGGSLAATSTAGSVRVNGTIDGLTGRVDLRAGQDVSINQPVLNLQSGSPLTATAGRDVIVNAPMDGRGGVPGGTVTLTGARDIALNSSVVTNDGAIDLTATTGAATMAAGTALASGTAAMTLTAAGDVTTAGISGGSLGATSTGGSVLVNGLIDGSTGRVDLRAGQDVTINQPVLNLRSGNPLTATAGRDVTVNAPVEGIGGVPGGAVTLDAARDININSYITTADGPMRLIAANGSMTFTPGVPPVAGLFAGTAPISLESFGPMTTGAIGGGAVTLTSRGGAITIGGPLNGAGGPITIGAAGRVDVDHSITNPGTASPLTVTAGTDINLNAPIGRSAEGVASSAVVLTAGQNVHLNESIVTEGGSISVTALNGAVTTAAGQGLFAGTAPITLQSTGDLTTGAFSGGSLSATSTGGSVLVNGAIDGNTGRVDLRAALDVSINQPILNLRSGSPLTATAGRDVIVNAPVDGRGGVPGGTVTLTGARDVALNRSVVTNNGAIDLTATTGAATMAAGTALASGNAAITLTAAGDVTTAGISGGSLAATSTGGSVLVNGVIDGSTGRVDLRAGQDVTLNQPVLSLRSGSPLTATAGRDITVNVNAAVDGRGGVPGAAVTFDAARDITVNSFIATADGAARLTAATGAVAFAPGAGLFAGTAAISLDSFGPMTTGATSGGIITLTSRGDAITIGAPLTGVGGAITIGAAGQVDVNHSITNPGTASPLAITAGTDINLNAQIGRTGEGIASSAVALTAGQHVQLNESIVTEGGSISVTAQNGAVTAAAGEGLFAGTGSVTVESGQTLSTPTVATTGTLTLRSTSGSVNVATPIGGETGAVTIAAAADVDVNQAIGNPRVDAPLTVTAGRDINVNAAIDGRDDVLTGPSGTVTMTAGNDIALNESLVTKDSTISLTAQAGTIATASGKGLFSGSGAISVTSGGTLNTGLFSTTGALNITSTGGGVNIDRPIDDTTGSVSITAATTVNVNQTITNLKSGSTLAIAAGVDINVLAQIEGRGGTAGGTVTMTAGNDLNVTNPIATNNGAVTLTATNGSITLPTGQETFIDNEGRDNDIHTPMQWIVSAGNAPVSLTSGASFSLTSPVVTTGAVNITSTGGGVNVAAPITDETGPVTITAADALTVRHQVKSANQPITLNAGAGGITVFGIVDYDQTMTAPVNSGSADLTLNSVGDVSIQDSRGIATSRTLTIDTRGRILTGSVGNSPSRPQAVVLNADGGIPWFDAGNAGSVSAASSGGSISLGVNYPGILRVTTGTPGTTDCPTCDISVSGLQGRLGPDVILNAGGSVNLPYSKAGTLTLIARSGDVKLTGLEVTRLSADAGRDVKLSDMVWVNQAPVSLTAGHDIVTTPSSPIHISNAESLTLTAGRNVTLNLLETLGPLSITASTGNITLNNDIGPVIINNTGGPHFNPLDKGVASLTMSAPAASALITMQGARAEGDVVITTGGSLTAAKAITSVSGRVTITTGGTQSLSTVPIGSQNQLALPGEVSPGIPPGPRAALPTPPGLASAGASGLPAFSEIAVAGPDGAAGSVTQPATASGSVILAGTPGGAAPPAGTTGTVQPGATGGWVTLGGTPGAAAAPGTTTGAVGAPGTTTTGGAAAQPSGSSDPSAVDTASALRTTGLACPPQEESDKGTALAAVNPVKKGEASDKQKAACPPAKPAEQAAAETPAVPAGSGGTPARPNGRSPR